MIVAINYANSKYKKAQKINSLTAKYIGRVDKVISYTPGDIDKKFIQKNKEILSQKRGNGYWLWKPYIIKKTLGTMHNNDYLVYLDSGAFYINNVLHLIKEMEKESQYIMAFELPFKERFYTKRDVFAYMNCDTSLYTETNQRMATMIIIKKTEKSVQFVDEWLEYGQLGFIITDARNNIGKSNYSGFIENRHDQSIFSVLSKKYKINAYRDPSQFGRFADIFWRQPIGKTENKIMYPQIIAVHRFPEVSMRVFIEQILFAYAPKQLIKFYFNSGLYQKGR